MAFFGVGYAVELYPVEPIDVAYVAQPILEWAVVVRVFHRRPNSAAVIVAADDNVWHLEHVDRVLQH